MKKRLRSRVLAVGMVGCSALVGAGAVLLVQSQDSLHAQDKTAPDKPSAVDALKRGQTLLDQQQYAEAKKVLQDIDPAQLPEAQRATLDKLKLQVDSALAAAAGTSSAFDNGKAALDAGQLAQAAKLFASVVDSPNAPADVKQNASIQLALVREKQKEKAPAMKALLAQAQKACADGRLDEAQNALYTIEATGSDLGWQDNAEPAKLQRLIAEKRVALAQTPAPSTVTIAAPASAGSGTLIAVAPATAAVSPAAAMAMPTTTTAPAAAAATSADIMSETIAADEIQRRRILVIFNDDMLASQNAFKAGDFQKAVDQADAARAVMDTGKQFFTDAEFRMYSTQAMDQYKSASKAALVAQQQETSAASSQAALQEQQRAEAREQARRETVNRLMGEAHAAYDQQQLPQAAGLLEQILKIDPNNNSAAFMLQVVTDRINFTKYKQLTTKRDSENTRQSLDATEELIPYDDLLIYPEDWPEISRRRQGEQTTGDTEANRKTRERLEADIGELSVDQQPFEKVIKYLAETQNVNIFVNWTALTAAGIDKNTQLSVNLHNVPFRKALTTVLSEVGGTTSSLAYTIDDGVITISTKDELNSDKYKVVRVYDIRDMLVQPDQNINPPQFDLQNITANGNVQAGGGGGVAGGGGGGLFGGQGQNPNATPPQTRADIVKEILTTIKATVAPTSWVDNGGIIGSIVELNGQLIVNQTVDNQLAVYNLLQQLRETRAIQIAIEARLLLVSNNFLDDFGLGWGLSVPTGNLGGNVGLTTINSNASTLGVAPATGITGNLGGGTLGGDALDISTSILDNWSLSLLLRATQADKRTSTVQAPRVTLFNGQRGYLAVTNQQNFISNFNQTVAAGGLVGGAGVGTNLTVSTLTTGIVLDVEATVSADRRYVVMKLKPQLSSLDGIDTFGNINAGANGTATASSVPGSNLNFIPGGIFLQLPRITYTTVDTMVSVPDGGTLLIGGQKLAGEAEVEVGVPILSKIPGLNRLFTNRSFTRDERTLLILVRPKIIIQREEEFKTFGMNFDTIPTNSSAMIPSPPAGGPITPVVPAGGAAAGAGAGGP